MEFTVLREATRAQHEYDQDDLQAIKTPSMMQAMMEMQNDSDDDDEEESDDDKDKAGKDAAPAETKKDK